MREISAAVQEGARAYLTRQYLVIGLVGVVLFVLLIPLQNIEVAVGFAIGGLCSAPARFIGIERSGGANNPGGRAGPRGGGPPPGAPLPRGARARPPPGGPGPGGGGAPHAGPPPR